MLLQSTPATDENLRKPQWLSLGKAHHLHRKEGIMKKLILIGLAITSISGVLYASSQVEHFKGTNRFIENLNLDDERTVQVEEILSSYMQIKDLAMTGQFEQIPVFLEDKEAELAAVLSEQEMLQFKENIGKWAEGKDFDKYKKFAEKFSEKQH